MKSYISQKIINYIHDKGLVSKIDNSKKSILKQFILMSQRSEYTFHQKRYTDSKGAYDKMLNIIRH